MPPIENACAFLRHINFQRTVPYEVATEIQNHLVAQQLDYKALKCPSSHRQNMLPPSKQPCPHVLTFGTSPVYTFGRRERISSLSKSVIESLIAPMPGLSGVKGRPARAHRALLFETLRGGQTTYHGPGQLIMWPILDIKTKWPGCGPLDVRGYVRILEESTILTLEHYGFRGVRTRLPGVWEETGKKKIAALGVHLRRNISSFGVACNLNTDLRFFERIKACGMEGNRTTSIKELTGIILHPLEFGIIWVENLAKLLYGMRPVSSATINTNTTATASITSCAELNTTATTPNFSLKKGVQRGRINELGLRPELLRRLWYQDVSREMIKWNQKVKKIKLEEDHDQIKASLADSSQEESTCTTSHVSQSAPDDMSLSKSESFGLDALLGILDREPKEFIQPSFRKCSGISFWNPPIEKASSGSVVRKVGVNCIRGQNGK